MTAPQEPKTGTEPSPSDRPSHPYDCLEAVYKPDLIRLRAEHSQLRQLVFNLTGVCGGIYALEKDFPVLAAEVRDLGLDAGEFKIIDAHLASTSSSPPFINPREVE